MAQVIPITTIQIQARQFLSYYNEKVLEEDNTLSLPFLQWRNNWELHVEVVVQ